MGFTLSMAPIREAGSGCESEIVDLIRRLGGTINDAVAPANAGFPFLDDTYESENGGESVAVIFHEEVGWSWWDVMVAQIAAECGPQSVAAMSHMKAWLGAAFPFDVPNQSIGDGSPARAGTPVRIEPRQPGPLDFLKKLFRRAPAATGTPPEVQAMIDQMVADRSGGSSDCRIGSGPRILSELEAACRYWGLPEDESEARGRAEELYEEAAESDEPIPHLYALMCRSFFRHAAQNHYIVWFIK